METVRWYTLNYSYMHCDALTELIDSHLKSHLPPLPGQLLHIAFGCGPGTDSWSVIRTLGDSADIVTLGYDHNKNMIELAQRMTGHIVENGPHACQYFTDSELLVQRLNQSRQETVIVTINALFGQVTIDNSHVVWIADLINQLADRKTQVFVLGTHPEFSPKKVDEAWQTIMSVRGSKVLHQDSLDIDTWSATYYNKDHWSSSNPWQYGQFGSQSAYVIRVK